MTYGRQKRGSKQTIVETGNPNVTKFVNNENFNDMLLSLKIRF